MTAKDLGREPAYPRPLSKISDEEVSGDQVGLTKRERFAMMAMSGQLSCAELSGCSKSDIAKHSVEYADALLDELAKEK